MKEPGNIEPNQGWEAFCELLEKLTQPEVTKVTGIKQPALSAIKNLRKKPNVAEAVALSDLGIEVKLWTLPLRGARGKAKRKGAA